MNESNPARGTIEYAMLLERRIKEQREQLGSMNLTKGQGNRSDRKRIAMLERLLGSRELKLAMQHDGLKALGARVAGLEEQLDAAHTDAQRYNAMQFTANARVTDLLEQLHLATERLEEVRAH